MRNLIFFKKQKESGIERSWLPRRFITYKSAKFPIESGNEAIRLKDKSSFGKWIRSPIDSGSSVKLFSLKSKGVDKFTNEPKDLFNEVSLFLERFSSDKWVNLQNELGKKVSKFYFKSKMDKFWKLSKISGNYSSSLWEIFNILKLERCCKVLRLEGIFPSLFFVKFKRDKFFSFSNERGKLSISLFERFNYSNLLKSPKFFGNWNSEFVEISMEYRFINLQKFSGKKRKLFLLKQNLLSFSKRWRVVLLISMFSNSLSSILKIRY